jgi:hypothetical protein
MPTLLEGGVKLDSLNLTPTPLPSAAEKEQWSTELKQSLLTSNSKPVLTKEVTLGIFAGLVCLTPNYLGIWDAQWHAASRASNVRDLTYTSAYIGFNNFMYLAPHPKSLERLSAYFSRSVSASEVKVLRDSLLHHQLAKEYKPTAEEAERLVSVFRHGVVEAHHKRIYINSQTLKILPITIANAENLKNFKFWHEGAVQQGSVLVFINELRSKLLQHARFTPNFHDRSAFFWDPVDGSIVYK